MAATAGGEGADGVPGAVDPGRGPAPGAGVAVGPPSGAAVGGPGAAVGPPGAAVVGGTGVAVGGTAGAAVGGDVVPGAFRGAARSCRFSESTVDVSSSTRADSVVTVLESSSRRRVSEDRKSTR